MRIAYVKLNDNFMQQHDLIFRPEMAEFENSVTIVLSGGPFIKPQYPAMAKAANMEKNAFHNSLNNIFTLIGELLSESDNVEIDLNEYGKF